MKKWAILAGFCIVTGCSTSQNVTLPDGTQGKIVQCNGTLNSIAGCQIEAGKACPNGYAVIDGEDRRGLLTVANGNGGTNNYATATRSIMIKCRPAQ